MPCDVACLLFHPPTCFVNLQVMLYSFGFGSTAHEQVVYNGNSKTIGIMGDELSVC